MRKEKRAYPSYSYIIVIICEFGRGQESGLIILRVINEFPEVYFYRLNRTLYRAIYLGVLGRR